MRRGLALIVVVAAYLLQIGLLPALRPFGIVPNLALVMVVLVGLEGTASSALLVAVVGGVMLDLASGVNFGLWTGILMLAAIVTGIVHRAGFELGGGVIAVVLVAAGTVLMSSIIVFGMISSGLGWPGGAVAGLLLGELVINLMLTISLRPLMRWTLSGGQAGAMPAR